MRQKKLVVFTSLALILLVAQAAEGKKKKAESEEEEKKGSEEEVKNHGPFRSVTTCHGQDWEQPKTLTKANKKCDAERKKGTDEKGKNKKGAACFAQCLWRENEMIKGEGEDIKLEQDAVNEFVDEMLPGNLKPHRAELTKAWKGCKKEIDVDEEDDEKCSRFKPYFQCIKEKFISHCGAPVLRPIPQPEPAPAPAAFTFPFFGR